MWQADLVAIDGGRGLLVALDVGGGRASFCQVLEAWQNDEAFRQTYIQTLCAAPFTGFRRVLSRQNHTSR